MKWMDEILERGVRNVANRTSRRGALEKLGALIAGAAVTIGSVRIYVCGALLVELARLLRRDEV